MIRGVLEIKYGLHFQNGDSTLQTYHDPCVYLTVSQTRVVGQACVDTSECNLVNTECRDGLCQCDISFAYNHNNDTCVSGK